jgi:hypothetical protein
MRLFSRVFAVVVWYGGCNIKVDEPEKGKQKMNTPAPKLEIFRTQKNGKPALEVVVHNARSNPALLAECERPGLAPTVDMSNRRSVFVSTPAELDAIREPLKKFFGR